jgi:glycosyltransferase involved in cell wall biosynthesis
MISILMPVYNGIEFIHESVSSILNQDFHLWELIIGVNGHPPNSEICQIAKKYESVKVRVMDLHYIKGKANALNEMIKFCHYDYVSLLDVDDIWLPNKLSKQMIYMDFFDVIGTRCVYFGDLEGTVPNTPVGNLTKNNINFLKANPIINSSCLVRKDLCHWEDASNGGISVEDYDMWLRLWKQGKFFYNCDDVLVKHRIHKSSAFNAKGNNNMVADLIKKYS